MGRCVSSFPHHVRSLIRVGRESNKKDYESEIDISIATEERLGARSSDLFATNPYTRSDDPLRRSLFLSSTEEATSRPEEKSIVLVASGVPRQLRPRGGLSRYTMEYRYNRLASTRRISDRSMPEHAPGIIYTPGNLRPRRAREAGEGGGKGH